MYRKKIKICLVTSRGGHLYQLFRLSAWWKKYNRFWVTFAGEDTRSLLKNEKIYFGFAPESRNIVNAVLNTFLAIRILLREKPDLLISTGAGIAPPFFYIGKLLGCKLIFIEPFDFIKYPTLSGILVSPITDKQLVQHTQQLVFYKKANYWGSTLS